MPRSLLRKIVPTRRVLSMRRRLPVRKRLPMSRSCQLPPRRQAMHLDLQLSDFSFSRTAMDSLLEKSSPVRLPQLQRF
jgi:hypothetical protein